MSVTYVIVPGNPAAVYPPPPDVGKVDTGLLPLSNGGTSADLSATGGTGQVLKQTTAGGPVTVAALTASDVPAGGGSPLTTKGDLWGYSSVNARMPVGADAYVLTADSTQPLGVKWAAAAAAASSAVFVASGASHAAGTVPDPGVTLGATNFLCEDATWKPVVYVGTSAPANATTGRLWYDTTAASVAATWSLDFSNAANNNSAYAAII